MGDKTFEVGQNWKLPQDNCTEYKCELKNSQPVISGYKETCPDVSKCVKRLRYQDGCCTKCKLEPLSLQNCFPLTLAENVTRGYVKYQDPVHGDCKNQDVIKGITQCAGSCKSGTKLDFSKEFLLFIQVKFSNYFSHPLFSNIKSDQIL